MRPEQDVNYAANPYGYPPKRERAPLLSKGLIISVAAVALLGGGATAYFALTRGGGLGGPPPILEADPSPTKSRPPEATASTLDPSVKAMEDRLVYERLSGTTRPTVERLLPPPEQPIPRPIVVPEPKEVAPPPAPAAVVTVTPPSQQAPQQAATNQAAPTAPPATPAGKPGQNAQPPANQTAATTPPATKPAATPPAAATKPTPPANQQTANQQQHGQQHGQQPATAATAKPPAGQQPAAVAAAKPPAAPPPATTATAPASGTLRLPGSNPAPTALPPPAPTASGGGGNHWRVQLASVHSEAEAAAEWRRLTGRYPALGGLSMQIAKADLGEKGVYYRVQGGSVDENRARAICDQLKSQNVGCVVVRP